MSSAPSQPQNQWAPGVAGQSSEGVGVYGRSDSARSSMAAVLGEQTGTGTGGIFRSENGVALLVSRNTGLGNVIEAWTQNPQNQLMRLDNDGNLYIDGLLSTGGADFAELLPAADGLEPGDVLVIGANGELARSSEAYQPSVVGVYSTKPGLLGGAPTDGESAEEVQETSEYDDMAPLAIIGIVPVKVSAENGPIAAGDLLTAASIPGHAMRCTDASLCFGRTLGKALEDLPHDTGVIQALVTLQ